MKLNQRATRDFYTYIGATIITQLRFARSYSMVQTQGLETLNSPQPRPLKDLQCRPLRALHLKL